MDWEIYGFWSARHHGREKCMGDLPSVTLEELLLSQTGWNKHMIGTDGEACNDAKNGMLCMAFYTDFVGLFLVPA